MDVDLDGNIVGIDDQQDAEDAREITKLWWLQMALGVLWMIFAFIVLTSTLATVAAVALLFGVGLITGGVIELIFAATTNRYRVMHIIFGGISIVAGIVALAWPGATFVVLAAIIAWYLLFDGIFGTVVAISSRRYNDLWWLNLIGSLVEVLIGVWAVGYSGRSVALLVIWVAAGAIVRGITSISSALTLHDADRQIRKLLK